MIIEKNGERIYKYTYLPIEITESKLGHACTPRTQVHLPERPDQDSRKINLHTADGEGGDGSEVQPMLDIGIFRPYDDTLGVAVALRSQTDGLKLVK